MYMVINKWVIAVKVSNFSGQYLRNHWTLDIGVLGYIGIVWAKEHSPEVWSVPPVTPCIQHYRSSKPMTSYRTNDDRLSACSLHNLMQATLSTEAVCYFQAPATTCHTTQYQHPEDQIWNNILNFFILICELYFACPYFIWWQLSFVTSCQYSTIRVGRPHSCDKCAYRA